MKLLVNKVTGQILDASNVGNWQVPSFAQVAEYPGDAETHAWPGGKSTSAMLVNNDLVVNPSVVEPDPVPTIEDLTELLKAKGLITVQDVREATVETVKR